jgi:hypothetical protein
MDASAGRHTALIWRERLQRPLPGLVASSFLVGLGDRRLSYRRHSAGWSPAAAEVGVVRGHPTGVPATLDGRGVWSAGGRLWNFRPGSGVRAR